MIKPSPINHGDKIAIISPATEVKPFWVKGAAEQLEAFGFRPVVMPHALGHVSGTYAATDAERLADLRAALIDPEIKCILCSRGGYGCNHLLSRELQDLVSANPKWMIGFSDVSALHALWQKAGVMSIHASMAKQLALFDLQGRSIEVRTGGVEENPESTGMKMQLRECVEILLHLITEADYSFSYTHSAGKMDVAAGSAESLAEDEPENSCVVVDGEARGRITGGNLAVLNGLAGTPWDILTPDYLQGKILFLEDIGEKIYQVERMLKRLQLAGVFEATAGVLFGQFTEYRGDANFPSMEAMIASRFKEWGVRCPVGLNYPIGHTHFNLPVVEGAEARLITRAIGNHDYRQPEISLEYQLSD